jgi:formylglycine-generating enzyme required for sulfatase activity
MDANPGIETPLNVFISYSRKDLAAAEHLRAWLIERKVHAYLDTHDILPGEDWQGRIRGLIGRADSVVFLVSPDSVASRMCDWEVNETELLGKRLLPVVIRDANPETVPGRLKRLNYIFLRGGPEDRQGLDLLRSALLTDIDWIRNHTRLGELAGKWDANERPSERQLRRGALLDAEHWLSTHPREAPEPTLLQRDFILESRKGELASIERERKMLRAMQRWLQAAVALSVLSVAGLIAWLNQGRLIEQYRWRVDMRPAVLAAQQEDDFAAKPGSMFKECAEGCPEMIVIPAGQFLMGAEPSWPTYDKALAPRHKVTIARPFAVAKTPVTFAEWQACVAAMACPPIADTLMGEKDRPVIAINWDQANLYAVWLARVTGKPYRLLSEAEFEFAARGITDPTAPYTAYFWGDEIGANNALCSGCGSQWDGISTAPVGSFKPNAFGLYDMNGNIWQWLEDTWHASYAGAPADGSAWIGGPDSKSRVNRGGSFRDEPVLLRLEVRGGNLHTVRYENRGTRVARTLLPKAP